MKYKVWNKRDTLVTPVGEVLTPSQVFGRYPASKLEGFKYVIADQPINMSVFMEFESTKSHYKSVGVEITEGMTDQQVLDAITEFEENPPEQPLSIEERIASALEFQVMINLPSEEE